jgi:hypothetical protein
MQLRNLAIETVTSAGGTYTVDVETLTDGVYLIPSSSPVTLVANVAVNFSGTPSDQQVITVGWGSFVLNGNTFTVNGISLTDTQALATGAYEFTYINGAWSKGYILNLIDPNVLDADVLVDETVTLAKIEDVTSAYIILGNASNRPAAVAVTGDIAITNAGVTSISAGVIVNADVNASAAIALSKLAALTASKVAVTDGSGIITTANQLTPALGGTGQDLSAATGFVTVSAGTVSAGDRKSVV